MPWRFLTALAVLLGLTLSGSPAAHATPSNARVVSGDGSNHITIAWDNPGQQDFVLLCPVSQVAACDYANAMYGFDAPIQGTGSAVIELRMTVFDVNNNTVPLPMDTYNVKIANPADLSTLASVPAPLVLTPRPEAPTSITATPLNGGARVNFTGSASVSVYPITGYTVTSSPGNISATGTASPIEVTGLSNGTAYTFTVTAANNVATGLVSVASNSVTPKADQTITFSQPSPQTLGTSPTLTATASSGLSVTFTSTTQGVCTITSGGTLTLVTTGSCTIKADQAGNTYYSAASQISNTFTVNPGAPGAPTIGAATAGDGAVSVAFTAPLSNGGSAITGYTVTSSPGGITGGGNGFTTSPITVTGLANGTAYTFTVTATNAVGTGSASAASSSTTPKGDQVITFTQPTSQYFGTTPTLTATASSLLTPTFTSSTQGVCTITSGGSLTFVTAGSCTINADQAGNSSYNAAGQVSRTFTVNPVVPGAPTMGFAASGDTEAIVSFTAPASTGGSTITGYTVTANPGGFTGTGTSSPITVTGLTNGVAYTFTVTATNAAGPGSASSVSNAALPAAPQTITFGQPSSQNFGTSPTLTATSDSGLTPTFTSSTPGVCTITSGGSLTFVTAGTCTINADQAGDNSYLPAIQVPRSFTVNAVVPGAPTIGTATSGDGQISVAFTAPLSNGGSAITGYTVTSSPGGITGGGNGFTTSPIIVTGLTNGTAYTFTVTATNAAGTGSASSASNSGTPAASQAITFNQPSAQNFGTTPTLTATSDSGLTPTFTSSTLGVCTITSGGSLTFVTAGTCTINADQAGNASFLPATQIPRSFTVNAIAPGAPTVGTATAGDAQATVTFTAPLSNGGSSITGYTVTSTPGNITATGATSPITVTGLTNGTAYTFTVTATNVAGTGNGSAASAAATPVAANNGGGAGGGGSANTPSASSDSSSAGTASTSTTTSTVVPGSSVPTNVTQPPTVSQVQSVVQPARPLSSTIVVNPGTRSTTVSITSGRSPGSPSLSTTTSSGIAGGVGSYSPGRGSTSAPGASVLSIAIGARLDLAGAQALAGSSGSVLWDPGSFSPSRAKPAASVPVVLATFTVAADGSYAAAVTVTGSSTRGSGRIQVATYDTSGQLTVASFAARVTAASGKRGSAILFDYGSAQLTAKAKRQLARLAAHAPLGTTITSTASGLRNGSATSPAGRLALARAKAVARQLADFGIATAFTTTSAGGQVANTANSRRVDATIAYSPRP